MQLGFPNMRTIFIHKSKNTLVPRPYALPNRVASSSPPAPPPTMTILCGLLCINLIDGVADHC